MKNLWKNFTWISLSLIVLISSGCVKDNPTAPIPTDPVGNTENGYFTVSRPSFGEAIKIGTPLTITWQSSSTVTDPYVALYLYEGNTLVSTISPVVTNNGSYTATSYISIYKTSSNYRIKVACYSDTSKYDFSYNFRLYTDYSGSINVTTPTALTVVAAGNSLPIQWQSSGTIGTYVMIELYYDTVQAASISTSISAASLSTSWYATVPNGTSNRYRIKITSTSDRAICGYSSYFTINSQYSGLITVTSPGATTSWNAGDIDTIRWVAPSTIGSYVTISYRDSTGGLYTIDASEYYSYGYYYWTIPAALKTGSRYIIRVTSNSDTTLHGESAPFTINGLTPDMYEFDGARATAHAITTDGTVQKRTLTQNDTDWVFFLADSGKTYLIQNSVIPYIYGYLYADSTTSIYSSYYGGASTTIPTYVYRSTRSGKNYLMLRPYTTSYYFGDYRLSILVCDSTTLAPFTNPVATSTWSTSSSYSITWTPDSSAFGPYVNLYLCNDTTSIYTIATYTGNSGNYSWSVPPGLATKSNYRIKMVNYSYSQIVAYSKQFTISGITQDAYEPDNKRTQATTITTDTVSQLHSIALGDTDWVKFSADSNSYYIIQIKSTVAGTYSTLYYDTLLTSTTTFYGGTSGSNPSILWRCLKTGTYNLATRYYSQYGDYRISIKKYNPANAGVFTNPTITSTWSTGSTYSITWTVDSTIFGSYEYLYLCDDTVNVTMIYAYTVGNNGSYSWSVPAGLATKSTYKIKMVNYNNTALYGYSEPFTISGIAVDTYEPDGKRLQATTITTDTVSQLHSITLADTDWVKFQADSNSYYIIQIKSAVVGTYSTLYDSLSTAMTSFYGGLSGNNPSASWRCPKTGTYYLATRYYSQFGDYRISIKKYNPATTVIFTNPTGSSTWSTGSTYSITWAVDSTMFGSYEYLYLCDDTTRIYTITTYTGNSGSYSWSVPAGLATKNTYKIKMVNYSNTTLYGYSEAFSISGIAPDAFERDNQKSSASICTTDSIVQNRSITYGDTDWVKFPAIKDSLYLIRILSTQSVYSYLYADSIASSYSLYNYGTSPRISWVCPASKNAFIRITPYTSTGYCTYSLWIKQYSPFSICNFTNPTNNSTWSAGTQYAVGWAPDTGVFGQYVSLSLCVDTTPLYSISTSTSNLGSYTFTPPAGLASGNTYRIKMASTSNTSIVGYSQQFTISGIAPDAYEPDDSASVAHAIATNGTLENHSHPLYDRDWYTFTGKANYAYVIRTTGRLYNRLYLYSAQNLVTATASANTAGSDSNATLSWFCTLGGTYYLKDTSAYYTGPYQISLTEADSSQYRFVITSPAVSAQVQAGTIASIAWQSLISLGGYVDIYLYKGSSTLPVATIVTNTANSGTYSWSVPTTLTAGADYYIKINSRTSGNIYGTSQQFSIGP